MKERFRTVAAYIVKVYNIPTMSGSHSTPIAASKDHHSSNIDAVSNQGQFHARRPRDHPLMTGGVSFSSFILPDRADNFP